MLHLNLATAKQCAVIWTDQRLNDEVISIQCFTEPRVIMQMETSVYLNG